MSFSDHVDIVDANSCSRCICSEGRVRETREAEEKGHGGKVGQRDVRSGKNLIGE